MRGRMGAVTVLVVLAVVVGVTATAAPPPAQPQGRYLVVFKADAVPHDAAARIAAHGGALLRSIGPIGVVSAAGGPAFARDLARDPGVLAVGPEHVWAVPGGRPAEVKGDPAAAEAGPLPADSLYYYQWDIRRIGAPAVWDRLPLGPGTPAVAVLDVGVMTNHPDLAGAVATSVATSYCPTGDGYPIYQSFIDFDTFPDWSPADGCSTLAPAYYETHGTHVAGTIGARFGGGRVVGVAPDTVLGAYKVFDYYLSGGTLHSGAFDGPIFAAIVQATMDGYPVISMSLGGYLVRNDKSDNASYLAWDRVAKWANRNGALIVASAGNGAANLNGPLVHIPSDLPTVMCVSASAAGLLIGPPYEVSPGTDYLASYSNYGAAVDLAAPGGDCPPALPCTVNYLIVNDGISDTGAATYYGMAGTSMAVPHVSAVAAWVRAMHPDWTPGAVRAWVKTTAEVIGSRQQFGHGLVDAAAATQ